MKIETVYKVFVNKNGLLLHPDDWPIDFSEYGYETKQEIYDLISKNVNSVYSDYIILEFVTVVYEE